MPPEREISRNAARISALKEARQRINAGRDEAMAALTKPETAFAALPAAADLEAKLADINEVIAKDRSVLAEVRSRRRELRGRPSSPAAGCKQSRGAAGWTERKDSASTQIATLEQRTTAATGERTELTNAPQKFAGQRQALIGEIETARPHAALPRTGWPRPETNSPRPTRVARAALEAVGEARAEAARGEERCEAAKRRFGRHRARNPRPAADRAGWRSRARRGQRPAPELPQITEARSEARPHPARARAPRAGQSARRAGTAEVEEQHTKLCGERDDLVEAIRGCSRASTASTARRASALLASFVTVNENFKKLFGELFRRRQCRAAAIDERTIA